VSAYNPVKARTRLLARYGLKPEDYARLFLAQGAVCAICRRPPSGRRMLDIDHCHQTLEIRGLLCHRCNRGLGYFSREHAERVGDYMYGYNRHEGGGHQYTGYFVPKKRRTRRAGINGGSRKRGSGDA